MVMSGTKLTQLFLFNPSWGRREGEEEEKLVFHWPTSLDANTKVRSVGLIEAVVNFSSTFSKEPAESLHNLKSRSVFRQVEPCALHLIHHLDLLGRWSLDSSSLSLSACPVVGSLARTGNR